MSRKSSLSEILSIAIMTSLISTSIVFALSSSTTMAEAVAAAAPTRTMTPIKHIVVIFQENTSFDHYFGTYPNATNANGEPRFIADPHTPSVNGLTGALLKNNPNGNFSVNPFRLDRSQSITCDMNHDYLAEQKAYNGGLMDKFIEYASPTDPGCTDLIHKKQVMGYYDGNTVTALWNYAQHFAMNDNSYSTTFGPSTPGHINLISGQTHGANPSNIPGYVANGTLIANAEPAYDVCSDHKKPTISMAGKNVGDLLNSKDITWGWFIGGFKPVRNIKAAEGDIYTGGNATCYGSYHKNIAGKKVTDYDVVIEPFQYYKSTSNPRHLPPSSTAKIGYNGDQANHQYDLGDFWNAAQSGNLPAVSFLKPLRSQNGHPEYSDPLDEQTWLVNTINRLQNLPEWNSTAVIIAWDDSDGWYDHVMPPIVSQSSDPKNDALLGADMCGRMQIGAYPDRCGYGPRQPLLVVSPYAKTNFVDHTITDQTSILRFIEDNWGLGRIGNQSFDTKAGSLMHMFDFTSNTQKAQKLFLDPSTGLRRS